MGIPWRQAYRLIANLDDILAAQPAPDRPAPLPLTPTVGVPTCTRLESSPGRWLVEIEGWLPASDNVRAKGLKRWIRAKSADREVLRDWLVGHARIPRATTRRRLAVWVAKKGRRPDGANLLKSLCDGLVNVGLLVDDRAEWLEVAVPVVSKGEGMRTTILLEDIA